MPEEKAKTTETAKEPVSTESVQKVLDDFDTMKAEFATASAAQKKEITALRAAIVVAVKEAEETPKEPTKEAENKATELLKNEVKILKQAYLDIKQTAKINHFKNESQKEITKAGGLSGLDLILDARYKPEVNVDEHSQMSITFKKQNGDIRFNKKNEPFGIADAIEELRKDQSLTHFFKGTKVPGNSKTGIGNLDLSDKSLKKVDTTNPIVNATMVAQTLARDGYDDTIN